jgi:hypothetical protein
MSQLGTVELVELPGTARVVRGSLLRTATAAPQPAAPPRPSAAYEVVTAGFIGPQPSAPAPVIAAPPIAHGDAPRAIAWTFLERGSRGISGSRVAASVEEPMSTDVSEGETAAVESLRRRVARLRSALGAEQAWQEVGRSLGATTAAADGAVVRVTALAETLASLLDPNAVHRLVRKLDACAGAAASARSAHTPSADDEACISRVHRVVSERSAALLAAVVGRTTAAQIVEPAAGMRLRATRLLIDSEGAHAATEAALAAVDAHVPALGQSSAANRDAMLEAIASLRARF